MGGDGEPFAVGVGDEFLDPAEVAGGEAAQGPVAAGAGQIGDLDGVLALGVGDIGDLAAAAEHLGEPDPYAGGVDDRAGRAVAVGQPVEAAAYGDGAGAAGLVDGDRVDVVGGGHLVAAPADALAAESHLQLPGAGVGGEGVDDPQVAGALVDDPAAVAGGVPGVELVVVGVPEQVGAAGQAGVEVADALVVGEEGDPAVDGHGAVEVAADVGQQPFAVEPEASGGPAEVALPGGRFVRRLSGEEEGAALPSWSQPSSVTAMSETGPQGWRMPGEPSVWTV